MGDDVDKTLQKGLRIIEALCAANRPLGVTELSEALGYTKSTVHRLLQTLRITGWVVRRESTRDYSLSLRLWEIGIRQHAALDLPRVANGHAWEIARESEETVHIGVLERGEVVFLETIETPKPVRAYVPRDGRAPAHAVATGKIILAFLPEREWTIAMDTLAAFTSRTITNAQALKENLGKARRLGYAVNRGEWQEGVHGVAAPIFAGTECRVVGSIGLTGPEWRFGTGAMQGFARLVKEAAQRISEELGAPHAPEALKQQAAGEKPRLPV